ncbi:carbohydrate esterase family 4 protein [Mycena floridula]|nr:carbohydrate esterase family 4 protein [Mycena floridula]
MLLHFFFPFLLCIPASAHTNKPEDVEFKIIKTCTQPKTVALTFDDGPYKYMSDIVNTLSSKDAHGTFFLNGDNWSCIFDNSGPADVKHAFDLGHQIGSHTWNHSALEVLIWPIVVTQFKRTEDAIRKITGATPAFTRPPYGLHNDQVDAIAKSHSQNLVLWDFDSGDSTGSKLDGILDQYRNLAGLKSLKPTLTVNHETSGTALPKVIDMLTKAGYKLVTVAECLGMKPYKSTGKPQVRDVGVQHLYEYLHSNFAPRTPGIARGTRTTPGLFIE